MQDATDYASSGPIFLFLSSPLRILFLAPSLISLRFLSGLCSERRPFFFLPLLHISPQLGSVLRSRKEAQRQFLFVVVCVGVFFFFFFEFSCVRITRRCCCCCCFCLTLFNSHRRTTQSLISALKYTKTANKRREKEKKKKKKLA